MNSFLKSTITGWSLLQNYFLPAHVTKIKNILCGLIYEFSLLELKLQVHVEKNLIKSLGVIITQGLLDNSLGFLLVLNYEGGDLAKETEKRRSCTHNEAKLQPECFCETENNISLCKSKEDNEMCSRFQSHGNVSKEMTAKKKKYSQPSIK